MSPLHFDVADLLAVELLRFAQQHTQSPAVVLRGLAKAMGHLAAHTTPGEREAEDLAGLAAVAEAAHQRAQMAIRLEEAGILGVRDGGRA